jgi:hypothetical protein
VFVRRKTMKKNILFGSIILICILCITLIGLNINDKKIEEDTIVEGNVETKIDTVLDRINKKDLKKLDKENAIKTYKLEEITGIDIGVYTKENNDSFEEVAIIKFSNSNDSQKIQEKVMSRLIEITENYKDNEKILSIIHDSENIIIKQEGRVQTVIISEDAKELAEKIKIQF